MTGAKALIAIAGRPNVGKSTLFNRLVGGRPALVHDTPGLTRDRKYGEFDYYGHEFRVVDTGGLDPDAEKDVIGAGIHRQAHAGIDEADIVILVVDALAGPNPLDQEVIRHLRRSGKSWICAANKVDSNKRNSLVAELYSLGIDKICPISAVHGRGVDELIEEVIAKLELPAPDNANDLPPEFDPGFDPGKAAEGSDDARPSFEDRPIRVALIGKPNAGKSSLLNRIAGVERSLVHDKPGTTTDPVDIEFELGGQEFILVDTAGIRRRARVDGDTEKLSVTMALEQIRRADVVILMIDGGLGPTEQDARLAGSVLETGRALVIGLNKSDLLGGPGAAKQLMAKSKDEFHFLNFVDYALISALRGDGVHELFATVVTCAKEHRRRVSTAELNRFFADVCETHPPPSHNGRSVIVQYLTQAAIRPPTFLLWVNKPKGISPAYRRFLVNQLRVRYGFRGTPLKVFVRARKKNQKHQKKPHR